MNHPPTPPALADQNRPLLMAKLRRVGGFFILFQVLVLAAVHWIAQDIDDTLASTITKAALRARVGDALARINMILVVAGAAMAPVAGLALLLVGRFVRRHFEDIESATQRKSRLVRWVAHELRTPLNGIKGFAEILATGIRGPLAPGQAECVHEIRDGAAHMKAVLNDLLDLAKIEAGTIALAMEDVTVAGLLADVQGAAGPLAEARGIHLRPAGDLALEVRADFNRTRQVLLNLVSNAVKFSPEGADITIEAATDAGGIRLAVHDRGPGMTPVELAGLFEEFHQTTEGRAKAESAGLGLAISRKLIEAQGGRIWAESRPGEGTQFCFTLPAAAAA